MGRFVPIVVLAAVLAAAAGFGVGALVYESRIGQISDAADADLRAVRSDLADARAQIETCKTATEGLDLAGSLLVLALSAANAGNYAEQSDYTTQAQQLISTIPAC